MTNEAVTTTSPPRSVAFGRGWAWIAEGFGYFSRDSLAWIGTIILLIIITLALAFVPLLGNLASQILMPVFFAGMILGCHARAQGGEYQVAHLFAGFRQNTGQLIILGLLYLAGVVVIAVLLGILFIFGIGASALMETLQTGDASMLQENLTFIWLVVLIAAALYLPLLMAFWFAPALVILRNASAFDAMKGSFNGCLMNILPFLLYGIVGLVLIIVAMIPFGLGLLVLIPVITASIYTAYLDIYPAS